MYDNTRVTVTYMERKIMSVTVISLDLFEILFFFGVQYLSIKCSLVR